ncbi:MAG: hypothetical protein JXB30_19575 [Anaerolineae bacterium]|nr:hypothetical protein [Anaerolineae bacterium]
MSRSRKQPSSPRGFGTAAYLGTFLFIPVWDLFALGYSVVSGWHALRDDRRGEEAVAILTQPIRRLAFLAIAYALVIGGFGVLQGVIPQPGPFGFLVTGIGNLDDFTANVASGPCCEISTAVEEGTPVSVLLAEGLPQSLWLLGGTSVMGGLLIIILSAVALEVRNMIRKRGRVGKIVLGILRLCATGVMAAPPLAIGLAAVMFIGLRYSLLPLGGFESFPQAGNILLDRIRHVLLPSTVAALLPALLAAQAAVRTWAEGEADGHSEADCWSMLALAAARTFYDQAGWVIGGLVVIEPLFSFRGIGKLLLDAILKHDASVLLGALTVFPLLLLISRARGILLASAERAYLFNHPIDAQQASRGKTKAQRETASGTGTASSLTRKAWLGIAGLAVLLLLVPMIRGIVASPGDPHDLDPQAIYAPASPEHPLGTDEQGRDIQSRILEAYRISLGTALAGGLIALAAGGAWGGLCVAARLWRGVYGESLADFIRIPAEAMIVLHPALVALMFTVGHNITSGQNQSLGGMAAALGLILAPRLAWAVDALWEDSPRDRSLRWQLGGALVVIYLSSVFAVFQYGEAINFLTLGVLPPLASLGGNFSDFIEIIGGTLAVADNRFYRLTLNLVGAAVFQSLVLFTVRDVMADLFAFRWRRFLPRLFA